MAAENPTEKPPIDKLNEVLLSACFTFLSPHELAKIAPVSKFWQKVADQHPVWLAVAREFHTASLDAKKMDTKIAKRFFATMAKGAYSVKKAESGKVFGKKVPGVSNFFKKTDLGVFKNALSSGRLHEIHYLLSARRVNVNCIFDHFSRNLTTVFYSYNDVSPIHIAVMKKNPEVFRILLLHGADLSKTLRIATSSYAGSSAAPIPSPRLPYFSRAGVLEIVQDPEMRSLIYLAQAEIALKQNNLADSIRCFDLAWDSDGQTTRDYISKAKSEKVGLHKTYSDIELQGLTSCFDGILARPVREEPSSCLQQ